MESPSAGRSRQENFQVLPNEHFPNPVSTCVFISSLIVLLLTYRCVCWVIPRCILFHNDVRCNWEQAFPPTLLFKEMSVSISILIYRVLQLSMAATSLTLPPRAPSPPIQGGLSPRLWEMTPEKPRCDTLPQYYHGVWANNRRGLLIKVGKGEELPGEVKCHCQSRHESLLTSKGSSSGSMSRYLWRHRRPGGSHNPPETSRDFLQKPGG